MERILKATFLAGVSSGLVAPVIWPIVIWLAEGKWPDWLVYPMAALSVSFFAIIITVPCSIAFGSLALFGLEKLCRNTPAVAGVSGSIISFMAYQLISVSNDYPSLAHSWPVAAFFVIIGAFCGVVASSLSRTNKQFHRTRKSAPVN